MEKMVMAGGNAVRYTDFGKGEKVICLLHGYLESIEVWESFAGQLGKTFRVVAIDLPGHGFSDYANQEIIAIDYMADIVATVLDKAGIDKCCVVGHSMGGYVAAALAVLHPEKVKSLVFFHSSPSGDSDEKKINRTREAELIIAGKKEMLATVNPGRGFAPANLKRCENAIDELSEQIMMTEDKAIIAILKGLSERTDRTEQIAALDIPVLFIFGKHDNYIPVEAAQAIVEKQPKAQVAWLENSGHMGFVEEHDASMEILRRFV